MTTVFYDGSKIVPLNTAGAVEGTDFPATPNIGQLFRKTTAPLGVYLWAGSYWMRVEEVDSSSAGDLDDYVAKAGSSMTGYLTLSGPPNLDLHAATKKYVDDVVDAAVFGSGGGGVTSVLGSANIIASGTTVVTISLKDNIVLTGTVTANGFVGDGSGLTNLNANNITTGIVAATRLGTGTPTNETFLRGDGTWTSDVGSSGRSVWEAW